MCWSPAASLTLGVAGMATAAYAAKKGTTKDVTVPLAYFSLMEFIQFFGYSSVNQCGLPVNQWVTLISYIHIAFQPIFFNMLYFAYLPKPVSRRVRRYVYGASLLTTAALLVKVLPVSPANICRLGETLCAAQWCTVSGSWHIAWNIPWYTWPLPGSLLLYYGFGIIVLPLLYGAWRGVLFALIGPVIAYATTQNPNEWPAVWCLFSVALILLNLVHSKFGERWYFWTGRRSA